LTKRSTGKLVVVTLHPAVDRTVEVPRLRLGGVVRGREVMVEAAGKGINITHTLSNLGHHVLALGFLGQEEADLFLSSFCKGRVTSDFIQVKCATRESITIVEREARRDTHLLVGSLHVGHRDLMGLFSRLRRRVSAGDWAVFAGSCPDGVKRADLVTALRACKRQGARVCVDTSGPMLRAAIGARPWLIKPNRDELAELTKRRLRSISQVARAAQGLLGKCENILVSLGADGVVLVTCDGAWHARETRRARVAHTVGCGDALLGGFLAACASGKKPAAAARFAVACGSACARTHYASLQTRSEPLRFLPHVRIEPL